MAEATEETTEQTETQETTDEVTADQAVSEAETHEEREPGGASPSDVRARKEYRTRRKIENDLMAEREARIRLEEQLNAAKQQKKDDEKPVYTVEQVQAEVDAGRISPVVGAAYIAREEAKKAYREERQADEAKRPVQSAIERINEYREVLDWANDRTHPNFLKAQARFRVLVSRGSPANEATELTALEDVAGDLDTIRRKNQMRADTRANGNPAPANASGGPAPITPKADINKAPESMRSYWESNKVSQKSREREYQIYLDLRKQQRPA